MAVTNDKYQLPVAVADTHRQLAEMVGVKKTTITDAVNGRRESIMKERYKVYKVEV